MSPRQVATDGATKGNALRLAAEHGAAAAARETGVSASTIRSWMRRAGTSGPPSGADPVDWVARKQAGAASAWEVAQDLLKQVRQLISLGKYGDAQKTAISFAVLVDKAQLLENAAAVAVERQARLDRVDALSIIAVIEMFFAGTGLPFTQSKPLLAAILRMAEAGEPLSAPEPQASEARTAIRRAIEDELALAVRGLPAGRDDDAELVTGEVLREPP